MTKKDHNRLTLLYKQHGPYLYGALRVVKRGFDNQVTSNPFIISKTVGDREIVYGSVFDSIDKIPRIIVRYLSQQRNATLDWFAKRGLPVPEAQYRDGYALVGFPESEPNQHFIHDRESETEDTVLLLSVHLRTLLETFSGKFNRHSVALYNYDGQRLGKVSLKKVCDVLLHHIYFAIRDEFVTDLFSHESSLEPETFFGSKFSVSDFFDSIIEVINSITINEYVGMLLARLHRLSAESDPKDMLFAIQNVHSLAGIVRDRIEDSRTRDLLPMILGDAVGDLWEGAPKPAPGEVAVTKFQFTAPTFKIVDDLSDLRIEISFTFNNVKQVTTADCRELLKQIAQVYRGDALIPVERRKGPGAN